MENLWNRDDSESSSKKSKKVDICKKISVEDQCNRDFTCAVIHLAHKTAATLAVDSTLAVQIQNSNRKEYYLWRATSFAFGVAGKEHFKAFTDTISLTHRDSQGLYLFGSSHTRYESRGINRIIETENCKWSVQRHTYSSCTLLHIIVSDVSLLYWGLVVTE